MFRPSKWHPQYGEEFYSATVEPSFGQILPKVLKHTFDTWEAESLPLVAFDNCYKTEAQAKRQAEIMLYELHIERQIPIPQQIIDKYKNGI